MADVKTIISYKYKVSLQYLDTKKNNATNIKTECIKSVIIDHDHDIIAMPNEDHKPHSMPIIYVNLALDRSLLDDMIAHQNDNLMIMALHKYDKNADPVIETECWRKKCIYFLPNSMNKMDPVDYNEATEEIMRGDTYTPVTLGLMVLEHINNNKVICEASTHGETAYDIVKNLVSHFRDIIIEPFSYNEVLDQFILPTTDTVSKALRFINGSRVFYSTPYRFYQDFNHAYIISSSGRAIKRPDERYSSIVINIRDVDDVSANETGVVVNRRTGTYEVYVSYAATEVFDNTIVNKSRNMIRGMTSTGSQDVTLPNVASYASQRKYQSVRLYNDNEHMLENIEAANNMENFILYFSKADLDTDLFTINKRISIHNISRYQQYNGNYVMYRKRELYIREDESFTMLSMINLKRIGTNV